ncbi:MAG: DUF5916 domain-containing protein [Candidatus Neomarinimicrobiota bacterium]
MATSREEAGQLQFKTGMAERVDNAPVIDGIINDKAWQNSSIISEFLELEPHNLDNASEATEVRIIYDDKNLYFAFTNFHKDPGRIKKILARRDDWEGGFAYNSDWVGFGIDSRNDDQSGYYFVVNPAGVKVDVLIARDEDVDSSWDGVWEVKTSINNQGWCAEFKIPFSLFQFSKDNQQVWGLELSRMIYEKQEWINWPGKALGTQGVVSRWGILEGLKNIPTPKQLEIMPFLLGGRIDEGQVEFSKNAGLDIEYGLASNTTLNMAFNPDFGQVEADPSVLNLTAFETFFEEKRPFFVEGAGFFDNEIQLFHSRRIGRQPDFYEPEEGEIVESPQATTILGAMKIIGESNTGLSFGLIESVTSKEYGIWEYQDEGDSTVSKRHFLEPLTNYFIGRLQKPVLNKISNLGLMVTDVRRDGGTSALVTGVDWNFKFLDNKLNFAGQAAHSNQAGTKGNMVQIEFEYQDPVWWSAGLESGVIDEYFEINDLGFLRRNDVWWIGMKVRLRKQEPWGRFLNNNFSLSYGMKGRGDGLVLERSMEINQNNLLKNYWSFGFGSGVNFSAFSDRDVFQDDRAWDYKSETRGYVYTWFQTDRRKRLIIQPFFAIGRGEFSAGGYRAGLELTLKPTDNINIYINGFQDLENDYMQWVGIEDENGELNIIYANSEQLMRDFRFRVNWTFTPDLSLELFYQPFHVDLDYKTFYLLDAPRTNTLIPYSYGENPDFKINNTVGTFVLRWEYLLGSTFFLVYSLNDTREYSAEDEKWEIDKVNSLFLKLTYWFQN